MISLVLFFIGFAFGALCLAICMARYVGHETGRVLREGHVFIIEVREGEVE